MLRLKSNNGLPHHSTEGKCYHCLSKLIQCHHQYLVHFYLQHFVFNTFGGGRGGPMATAMRGPVDGTAMEGGPAGPGGIHFGDGPLDGKRKKI